MAVTRNRYLEKVAAMIKRSKKPILHSSIAGKITPVESPKTRNMIQKHQDDCEERPTADSSSPHGGVSYE